MLKGSRRRVWSCRGLLVWLMLELHNGNVQHNILSVYNIMLHWEWVGNLKIGVCDLRYVLHMDENVESLLHMDIEEAKNN